MHKRIMQKCAPIIDGFSSLNIFEVSYVEHKLKEIKNTFKKDYERNNQVPQVSIEALVKLGSRSLAKQDRD